jgi:zinc transport system substrate-binding protein
MRRLLIVLLLGTLAACGRGEDTPSVRDNTPGAPIIYTVNYPLAWAAGRLAGDWAEIRFPMSEQGDPAFWQPGTEQLAQYQQADLILLNGAGYARWLSRASLPQNRLVDTSRAFTDRFISVDSGPVHSHGPEGDHSHGEFAFTLWLDLDLYARQVQAIAAAMARHYPRRAQDVAAREKELLADLGALDRELQAIGRAYGDAPVLYSHPVYQYFERAYGFNGHALHWEPNRFPPEKDWSALGVWLAEHPARIMLWEDEPRPETRERLRGMGLNAVVFAPMGARPEREDFLSGMSDNLERLRGAAQQHVD